MKISTKQSTLICFRIHEGKNIDIEGVHIKSVVLDFVSDVPGVWLMPFGFLMDLWECHKQFMGIAKPKRKVDIDEAMPMGI